MVVMAGLVPGWASVWRAWRDLNPRHKDYDLILCKVKSLNGMEIFDAALRLH
jgi:hypothetical protein